MFLLPTMPSWNGFHPIAVHFPIALLAFVPVFILMAAAWPQRRDAFLFSALLTATCGVLSMVITMKSGSAAASVADITPEVASVIEIHQKYATWAFKTFSTLTGSLALLFGVAMFMRRLWSRRVEWIVCLVFSLLWLGAYLTVAMTGHQGAVLVHRLGVRSIDFVPPAE